jgi:hypothetical protein
MSRSLRRHEQLGSRRRQPVRQMEALNGSGQERRDYAEDEALLLEGSGLRVVREHEGHRELGS